MYIIPSAAFYMNCTKTKIKKWISSNNCLHYYHACTMHIRIFRYACMLIQINIFSYAWKLIQIHMHMQAHSDTHAPCRLIQIRMHADSDMHACWFRYSCMLIQLRMHADSDMHACWFSYSRLLIQLLTPADTNYALSNNFNYCQKIRCYC